MPVKKITSHNSIITVFLVIVLMTLFSCQESKPLPVLGKNPITETLVVEDHGQVLAYWAEQGVRDAVLINIDTHDDIRWVPATKINALRDIYSLRDWTGFKEADSVADRGLYNIGNWIYAGARLGMFREVYWVIPNNFFSQENPENQLRSFLLSNKFSVQDVETFKMQNNQFRGSLQGIPIIVCGLESLPEIKGPLILSIDTDFFPGYSDNYKASYLKSLHNMFSALRTRNYRIQNAVVSYSVNGDYLPPHLRWIGDAVAMFLSNPGALDEPPSERLTLLQQIDNAYRAVSFGEMLKFTQHYFSRYPEASLMLYKAYAYMLQGYPEKALAAAMESCSADKRYCAGLPYIGSLYFIDGQCSEAEKFFRAGYSADPELRNGLYRFAHCLRDLGKFNEALAYYKKDVLMNGSFPTDFLIFQTYLMSGELPEASIALENAISGLSRNPYAEVVNNKAANAIYAAIDYCDNNDLTKMAESLRSNRTIKQMFLDYPRP